MYAGEHPEQLRVRGSDCLSSGTIALFLEQMVQTNRNGGTKNFVGGRWVRKEVRKLWQEDILMVFPLWMQLHQLQHCQVLRAAEPQASSAPVYLSSLAL